MKKATELLFMPQSNSRNDEMYINMNATFEEKTYESYFNNELNSKSSIYFPLGQVQEGVIGVDSAANSRNWRLWWMIGYPFIFFPPFPGADFKDIAGTMENYLGKVVKNIPKMKVNLLFQYKKPEYITSKLGKEWDNWHSPYFRYDIYHEQHNLLVHLERSFGHLALILYAAPAIAEIDELVRLMKQRRIIDNSNFKKAAELTNHDRNTYIQAGTYSIACSEPEKIEDLHLLTLLESPKHDHDLNNKEFIINTRRITEGVITESKKYSNSFQLLMQEYKGIKEHKLLYSFLTMKAFVELTGIQWLIKTQA